MSQLLAYSLGNRRNIATGQWLTAGQPDPSDAAIDKGHSNTDQFGGRQQPRSSEKHRILGHAIGTAQVATVCHREAQIIDPAPETVGKLALRSVLAQGIGWQQVHIGSLMKACRAKIDCHDDRKVTVHGPQDRMTMSPQTGSHESAALSQQALHSLLQRDQMTGLYDGNAFELTIAQRQHLLPEGVPLGLVELRGLARFNDHHGRQTGDALLLAMARRFERLARDEFGPAIILFRISGSRFALLPPAATEIDRLRVEVRGIVGALGDSLLTPHGDLLSLRLAVGTVASNEPPAPQLSMIARRLAASPALVRAIDVEAAASGEGLSVLFQPQFAFADDHMTGAEALVRWQHPRLGEVGGGVLFAAAASAGLERKLSRAVWRDALAAMATWPLSMAHLRVALNVTAADLADPAMAEELLGMAAQAGVDAHRLTVEVTESVLIEHLESAAATLARLRDGGLLTALDDFGTGYSGLSWLKSLPVDYIKIDSGFARDASGAARDQTVLRGVVDIAHALDLAVLAEGVETVDQRQRLAALGCRWYQGYLRSPAIDSDALIAFAA